MTDRISEIKDRLAKATPGPWVVRYYPVYGAKNTFREGRDHIANCFSSAEFIANAPSDLAYLLERVATLTRDAERLDWLDTQDTELRINGWRRMGEDASANSIREAIDAAKESAAAASPQEQGERP